MTTHVTKSSREWTRREFLYLSSMAAAGTIAGCATNPVTGKSQLMLVSEDSEIQMDRQSSPHQLSADYGITQDAQLENYIGTTGKRIAALTHRPQVPYSFHCVNATYVNAYAFPGGTIATTRGILLNLDNEAELGALLGHELGHVNARHTAQQMSKGMVTQLVVGGLSAYVGSKYGQYADLASSMGMLGSGMLLASYSRDNERQADDLGMEYMVKAGYSPNGMIGLMDMLQGLSKQKSNAIELMFSTHPMSDERYKTSVDRAGSEYAGAMNQKLDRERYMDNTAKLRAMKDAIEEMQNGDKSLSEKKFDQAESHYRKALRMAPKDYAGLVMMSKCMLLQEKYGEAQKYAESAKQVYPKEAQAYHLSGFSKIKLRQFDAAYHEFTSYDQVLPGNPNVVFYKGLALEGMRRTKESANHYYQYLQAVNQGEQAKYAYQRLVEWGYVKTK